MRSPPPSPCSVIWNRDCSPCDQIDITRLDMTRLDIALFDRGLVRSRNRAAREIAAGRVQVNRSVVRKPSHPVTPDDRIELTGRDPWVARSAHKLLGALTDFGLHTAPAGAICLDAGASTGGFTQVLLAGGARRVHALDVGHAQLAPELSADDRVHDLSGHNLRDLDPAWLAPDTAVDIAVADLSFISLTLVIEPLLAVTRPRGLLLLMVKPQFELRRSALDKHGVVTSAADRAEAVAGVIDSVLAAGAHVSAWVPSRLPGPAGNREYFLCVRPSRSVGSTPAPSGSGAPVADIRRRISQEDS